MAFLGYGEGGAREVGPVAYAEDVALLAGCVADPDCYSGVLNAVASMQSLVGLPGFWPAASPEDETSGYLAMLGVTADATVVGLVATRDTTDIEGGILGQNALLLLNHTQSGDFEEFPLRLADRFKDGGTADYTFSNEDFGKFTLPATPIYGLATVPDGNGDRQAVFPLEMIGADSGTQYGNYSDWQEGVLNQALLALGSGGTYPNDYQAACERQGYSPESA